MGCSDVCLLFDTFVVFQCENAKQTLEYWSEWKNTTYEQCFSYEPVFFWILSVLNNYFMHFYHCFNNLWHLLLYSTLNKQNVFYLIENKNHSKNVNFVNFQKWFTSLQKSLLKSIDDYPLCVNQIEDVFITGMAAEIYSTIDISICIFEFNPFSIDLFFLYIEYKSKALNYLFIQQFWNNRIY